MKSKNDELLLLERFLENISTTYKQIHISFFKKYQYWLIWIELSAAFFHSFILVSDLSANCRKHSGLRLAITVGKKVLLYSWMHAEEWMDFTIDTIQGFQLIQVLYSRDETIKQWSLE